MTACHLGSDPSRTEGESASTRYFLFVLGPLQVFRGADLLSGRWRRKSLELLAYLAAHPDGAPKDQIVEALWPECDPKYGSQAFWHALACVRRRMRGLGSNDKIVVRIDEFYCLDVEQVVVDGWLFDAARKAADARDPVPLLEAAPLLYGGEFCEGRYFSWARAPTERYKQALLRVAVQLADGEAENENIDLAVQVLDKALVTDPYDEEVVRKAIRLEGLRDRNDLIVRRFRSLRRRLAEDLDVDVSPETRVILEATLGRLTKNVGDGPAS